MRIGRAPLVKVSCKPTLLYLVIVLGIGLISTRSNAQWWRLHAPSDFEECSEVAERSATSKEKRASLISECDTKFAGRRKPGGGYTYYDFMQNRHFDITGPNPTPEELKQIDQKYTEFLIAGGKKALLRSFHPEAASRAGPAQGDAIHSISSQGANSGQSASGPRECRELPGSSTFMQLVQFYREDSEFQKDPARPFEEEQSQLKYAAGFPLNATLTVTRGCAVAQLWANPWRESGNDDASTAMIHWPGARLVKRLVALRQQPRP